MLEKEEGGGSKREKAKEGRLSKGDRLTKEWVEKRWGQIGKLKSG